MKILAINLSLRPEAKVIYLPIGLAYIVSAIKRHGHVIDILDIDNYRYSDEYVERYLSGNKFDVVCMGCIVTGYKYVKKLANMIRRANPPTTIIVGNSVASSIPDILLSKTEVDIAVMGEGDVTITELIDALKFSRSLKSVDGICYKENGKIIKNPLREPIKDIDTIPFPEWDLFDIESYIKSCSKYGVSDPVPMAREKIRAFTISTARGCPFNCTFCYQVFKGAKYRRLSTNALISEIKKLKEKYNINYFLFNDDLALVSKKHAQEIAQCFLRENLKVHWALSCRPNLFTKDSDIGLAKGLKAAGCVGLGFSLENASPDILRMMNKNSKPEDFSRQCRILKKAGLCSWTSIVLGYPIETKETIRRTIDCCIENGIYPSTGYLTPQPATPMYEYAKDHGFITDEEEYLLNVGDRQDLRLNMTQMSDKEFKEAVLTALEEGRSRLGLDIGKDSLIKTGYYRSARMAK